MSDVEPNPYKGADGKPQMRSSVTAFVDILGYKNLMDEAFKKGGGDNELIHLRNTLDVAYQYLKKKEPKLPIVDGKLDFQVRCFTDNLVLGYPIPEFVGAPLSILMRVVDYIGYLQTELAREGYFIRGAISVGDLYVDDEIVFGPALMDAYWAEQNLAVYPRVVLCDSAKDPYLGEWEKVPELLVDSDQRIFVDYLDTTVMIAQPGGPVFSAFLEGHKTAVIAKLKEFADKPYIRAKYDWAATYHKAFCDNNSHLFSAEDKVPSTLLSSAPKAWTTLPSKVES
jgi:hypothetical protein